MSDTLMRQWQMLRLVPRHPGEISTAELKQRLADEGFDTTQRTIQRDLMTLSDIYPLTCDDRSKPFGWSWMSEADVLDVPCMIPDGFDLDDYIASGELAFAVGGTIKLEALFSEGAVLHLGVCGC